MWTSEIRRLLEAQLVLMKGTTATNLMLITRQPHPQATPSFNVTQQREVSTVPQAPDLFKTEKIREPWDEATETVPSVINWGQGLCIIRPYYYYAYK